MRVEFFPSSDYSTLAQALSDFADISGCRSLCLLGCDANAWQSDELTPILKAQQLPLIGGIFPEVIYQNANHNSGFVLVGLEESITPVVVEGLSDNSTDFEAFLDQAIKEDQAFESMLVFVDGLASRVGEFVDSLFALFGSEVDYIGGGAGSLSFESKPCVMTNQGVFQDAAALALLSTPKAVQVGHGWQPFAQGHVVTSVEKNLIQEIDYRNALEVYEEVIHAKTHEHTPLTAENFFGIAQSFPLGIKRAHGEHVVRDPIAISDEGGLICVGELSVGDHIDILTAEPHDLIDSTQMLSLKSAECSKQVPNGVLFIDCISRALFLKDKFGDELSAARNAFPESTPVFGVLVLGEIANSGMGYLEFYNKTSVIARM